MKRAAFAVFALFALCITLFSMAHTLQAAPPTQEVTVINDVGRPVPVTLGAPVTVNGVVRTQPANNPTPVSRIGILSVSAGSREDRQTIYTVPAGKRLYIESETAVTQASGGVKAQASVSAFNSSGGGLFYDVVPQVERGFWDGQGEIYEGSNAVPMFADAGQAVDARVWLNTNAPVGGGVRAEVGFSGYLVDLP